MVADINRLEEARLERFLFGVERIPLDPVNPGLRELQDDRCFDCAASLGDLGALAPDVDHFIPWARYPNNAIQNLVLAHEKPGVLSDPDGNFSCTDSAPPADRRHTGCHTPALQFNRPPPPPNREEGPCASGFS